MYLSNNHQRTLKKKVYYLQVLGGTQHDWGHSVKLLVEKQSIWTWGSAFNGIEGRVPRVSHVQFICEFKTLELELKCGKAKAVVNQIVSLGQPKLSKKEELHGWGSLASYLIM